jgi:hypothetical protein
VPTPSPTPTPTPLPSLTLRVDKIGLADDTVTVWSSDGRINCGGDQCHVEQGLSLRCFVLWVGIWKLRNGGHVRGYGKRNLQPDGLSEVRV